MTCAKSSTKVE